jgi:alkylation response protein AidB-like acyl-CoA dehydrogenase
MPSYNAPLRDIRFVMYELLDAEHELKAMPAHAELDREMMDAVLEEGAKFATQVAFPLNASGDIEGCTFHDDGVVTTPAGFKEAYKQFCEAGWPGLACDPGYGGQGLPALLNNRVYEMFNSANHAWLMYSGLSHAAYECLMAFGSDAQKDVYLPKLISGEWSGTMCLTEAQCGTDLGMMKTKAVPLGDDSFALTGSKIFISSGEHDVSENILHLVLARLPDAPPGTRGVSLFLVPKFLPDAKGEVGERNGVKAGSIEHKMGIRANATCTINLDAARGWLIGEPNKGLAAMFVMMNSSRLGVGMQALGVAEVATQNAVAYARDRVQGRSATGVKQPDKPGDSIMVHPDVRRMLFTCKAYTEGGRALASWTALLTDRERDHPDPKTRADAEELVAFLTPIVKGFVSDNAFETTNLALQVFGGHGYIRESGMEQYVRDVRINQIYEGTNGIQALDLLGRKVLHDHGAKLRLFEALVHEFITAQMYKAEMDEFIEPLQELADEVHKLSAELAHKAQSNPDEVGAASVPYMRVIGHFIYAWLWARMARVALDKLDSGDDFYKGKLATARFYFSKLLPETSSQLQAARAGAGPLMDLDAGLF